MSNSNLILILSKEKQGNLTEDLFDMGFIPLVKPDLNRVIYDLRHERFILLIYDGNGLEIDPLEFVLNVRDLDGIIPIIILGSSIDQREEELLRREPNVFLVDNYYQQVKTILKQILN